MSIAQADFLRFVANFDPEKIGLDPIIKSTTNGVDGALATHVGHPGHVSHPGIPYQPYGTLGGALLGDEDIKLNFTDNTFAYTVPEDTASHGPARKRVRVQASRKEQNKASARKTRERRKAAATVLEERLAANRLALAEVERSNVELLKGIEFAKGRVEAYTAALQPQ